MSSAHRAVDFEILKEPWNKYEIADGSIVKTRFVLKKVEIQNLAENKSNFNIDGQNLSVVYTNPELKGTPTNLLYSPIEIKNSVVKDELRYNTLAEEWNEYLLDDGTRLRLKSTVTKVSRTSKYDKFGDPIYLVDSNAIMEIKRPKQYQQS